jgi:hypothetical protein
MREHDYWQDQFSEDGSLNSHSTADTRIAMYHSGLIPPIFGDTLVCRGEADNTEVYFVFRMAKVGPGQDATHAFFTTWFPSVESGMWREVRMDTAEVTDASGTSTEPVPGHWMCAFHESDPVRIGNALPECSEILPNNLFVPGTRIEYFLKAKYTGSGDYFFLPDTSGCRYEEFEILPMMRHLINGWTEWPCLLVVDHFGQRGNWGERNSDRIARHLEANGVEFDIFNRLGPSSDLRNGIGRWAANVGQIGGPGTDKYNWGPGATMSQLIGYEHCILNAGNIYGRSIYRADTDLLTSWLVYFSGSDRRRTLWLSGDQICRELNRRGPWGPQFLNTVLCATYLNWSYSDVYGDFTYCLPMNGLAGNITCTPKDFYVRTNGCPRKLSEIGVSSVSGCNAVGEIEYNSAFDGTAQLAGVSNAVFGAGNYRTFTEGYDFCLIRTDDSQGPLSCGPDSFLTAWMGSLLDWMGHDSLDVCTNLPNECGMVPYLEHCTVEWRNLVCDDNRILVCPACSHVPPDDSCLTSWLYVKVVDACPDPMPGAPVNVELESNCDMSLCSSLSAWTNQDGEAYFHIRSGISRNAGTECCSVKTTVTALGVKLNEHTEPWLSQDMNAESVVDIGDRIIFAGDSLTSACRSDLNCDGIVDSLDLAVFNTHYWHACDPSLVTVAEGRPAAPAYRELAQNYPNPFNPYTNITFSLTKPTRVVLRLYDVTGFLVRTLLGACCPAGCTFTGWKQATLQRRGRWCC